MQVLPGPGGAETSLSPTTKVKPKVQAEVPKGGGSWQVRAGGSWVARVHYPTWVNCTWRVAVSPRQVMELEVLRFNTPERDLLTVSLLAKEYDSWAEKLAIQGWAAVSIIALWKGEGCVETFKIISY